jgi:hypothetical protein
MTKGMKTSEFYMAAVLIALNVAKGFGIDLVVSDTEATEAANNVAAMVDSGFSYATVVGVIYMVGRVLNKSVKK